jgi:hypothetical protein
VIAEPLLEPAVKATDIVPDTPAAEATRLVGAAGVVYGVTDPDAAADAADEPAEFTAFKYNV